MLQQTIDSQTTISVIIMRNDVEPGRDILKQLAESGTVACGAEIPARSIWEFTSSRCHPTAAFKQKYNSKMAKRQWFIVFKTRRDVRGNKMVNYCCYFLG